MSVIDQDRIARLKARLGKPPTEPSGNLSPPLNHEQVAPVVKLAPEPRQEPVSAKAVVLATQASEISEPSQERSNRKGRGAAYKQDIRSISKTGRLVQFSSRITVEVNDRIRDIVERRQNEINGAMRGPKYKYGICNFLEEAAFLFENTLTIDGDDVK